MSKEQFSSRWGVVLAALGMAIGAGNLWRFPRLAGQYGGTFIILWILFLFIWSIPLLLAEFSIGKKYKKGVIGSYASFAGKKYTWLGFFITLCTLGIAFYYSIVTAWALQYFGLSVDNLYQSFGTGITMLDRLNANPLYLEDLWMDISNKNGLTIFLYIFTIVIGVFVLVKGINKGLERVNKVLIPSLFVLLIIIIFAALNMEKGYVGLEYMFTLRMEYFSDPNVWIEALSQSAWSTGAGWGLMMTIASYSRSKEDVVLNTFIGAFGNNTASLIAGMAILPAVFALAPSEQEAITYLQQGNQALTFNVIPNLFARIPGGDYLAVLFFLALFLAAFSSLLPMIELFISNVMDIGISRKKSIGIVVAAFIIFGFPSAYSLAFFSNQDWVWGIGLILSGFFILFAVARFGASSFKTLLVDIDSDFTVSRLYFSFCTHLNLFMAVGLIYWWMSQGYSSAPWFDENGTWNVFDVYSNATIITQWAIILIIGYILNSFLYRQFVKKEI